MKIKKVPDARLTLKREQAHAEMLKAALERPGVNEVMQVYGGWREKDQALNPYRTATSQPVKTVTTNSSSEW